MNGIKVFLIFTFVVLAFLANAQTPGESVDEKLSIEQLKGDLKMLRDTLEASQPGLYLYTSKDSLDQLFNKINDALNKPMTSMEFYRIISPLNELIKNLHTRFWPEVEFQNAMETVCPKFPIDIYWENEKMIVLRDNSMKGEIPSGSMITSINGEKTENIFIRLLNNRFRDGYNLTYPQLHLIRYFGYFYATDIATPESFLITFSTPDGMNREVEIAGATKAEIAANRLNRYHGKYSYYGEDWNAWVNLNEPAFTLSIHDSIATLTLRTFYHPIIEENGQGKFQKYFDEYFDKIIAGDVKHLILDVRDNLGGSDAIGMKLLSHLVDSSFRYYKKRTSMQPPNMKSIKRNDGYEIIGNGVWTGKVKPSKTVYNGNLYVLMNGYSISAAGEFIGHLKNFKRAVFIGEEAGGNPVQFTGGQTLEVILPHSKIKADIPLHQHEMNVGLANTGHGVMPDYEIHHELKDVLESKDVEMDFVLKLIHDQR